MKTVSILLISLLALTGCANVEYTQYLAAQTRLSADAQVAKSTEAVAKYNADAAKYRAMADIAASGTESAKVAAVMAIALGTQQGNGSAAATPTQLQLPGASPALQWASILVPSLTNIAGIAANMRVATVQSNNSRDVAVSTNSTFAGMGTSIQTTATSLGNNTQAIAASGSAGIVSVASMIQAPTPNVTNTNTISGDAVIGAGTLTKTDSHAVDNHAVDNHSVSPTPVVITPATQICTANVITGAVTCN